MYRVYYLIYANIVAPTCIPVLPLSATTKVKKSLFRNFNIILSL